MPKQNFKIFSSLDSEEVAREGVEEEEREWAGSDAEKQKLASMVGLGIVGVLAMIYMNQMNYRYVVGK